MAKTKAKTTTKQTKNEPPAQETGNNKIGFPNVKPSSLSERNQPKKPVTLRVCGNTIPVRNGKAGESDPRELRRRRKALAKKRGLKEDEERV